MRDINLIVIHCTATQEGRDCDVATIRSWHMGDRGFSDIGYHFLIHLDGTIERGRPWDIPGAHAQGYNRTSIGVAYVGGVNNGKPKDTRTKEQKIALRAVVGIIRAMFPLIQVMGHRDLSVDLNGDGVITSIDWMKACPSFDVKTEL